MQEDSSSSAAVETARRPGTDGKYGKSGASSEATWEHTYAVLQIIREFIVLVRLEEVPEWLQVPWSFPAAAVLVDVKPRGRGCGCAPWLTLYSTVEPHFSQASFPKT